MFTGNSPLRQRCNKIVQTMILPAHQNHDALLARRITDVPVHIELAGQPRELRAELDQVERQRVGENFLAHEKALRLQVGVVARLDDPALVPGDEAAHGRDDA